MKNHTSSLLLLSLMLATVCTLNLHPHLSSSHQSESDHDVAQVDHDTSQQYTLYRDTLDLIGSHTVITPPSVIPTAQLPTTSFTSLACTQMSHIERGMLALDLVLIRDKLSQVRQALVSTTLTRAIYKIRTDVTNQQLLTKTMSIIISSNCSTNANLQATAMQSNLVVDRWMLGNIPMTQLIQQYTDRSLTNQYVTNCPEENPWYTPDGCIPCNQTEYFNLETRFCEECADFDWDTHTCISDIGIMNETNGTNQIVSSAARIPVAVKPGTNTSAKNTTPTVPAGKTPAGANNSQNANNTKPATNVTGNTTKPAANQTKPAANATKPEANATQPSKPSQNGTHPAANTTHPANASKPEENQQNPEENKEKPATNPSTNPTKPAGPSSGKQTPSNPEKGEENPTNPSTGKPNSTIPTKKPNSSNTKVGETNPEDQEENPDSSKNATAAKNQTKPNATSPSKPNTTAPAKSNETAPENETQPSANETKPNGTAPAKPNPTTPANETKPNANQTKPNATAPSTQTKANTTSPSANKTNTTAPIPPPKAPVLPPNATNPKISDRILLSSSSAQPKESSSDIPCPEATPFYNGIACIQCNAPHNLFDLAKKQCSSCPNQFNFNASSNTCEKINNDLLTAKTSANLINAGMSTNYWNYLYDNVKSKNASVKNCPIATPYYSSLNKCIACTAPTKYFNLDTRKCQGCAAPFVYNETQRDCIDMSQSDHPVSGNALKMSGTIFSHQAELLQLFHGNSLTFRPNHQ